MNKRNTALLAGLLVAVIYPLSYLIISRNGYYEPILLGAMRAPNGETILAPKSFGYFWMPFKNAYPKNNGRRSLLTYFYKPMILLDRAIWHQNDKVHTLQYRTKNYCDPETFECRDFP